MTSFFARTFSRLTAPRRAAGVEMTLDDQGQAMFHYVVLEKAADRILIKAISVQALDWEALKAALPKALPVGLAFEGKNLLVKKMPPYGGSWLDQLPHFLPNIQIEKFAYQYGPLAEGGVLALARQETVRNWMDNFIHSGHYVLSASLAFLDAEIGLNVLETIPKPFGTSYWMLDHEAGHLVDFHAKPQELTLEYLVGDITLTNYHWLAFTAGLNVLLQQPDGQRQIPGLETSRANYIYESLFKNAGIALIAIMSVMLLVNALVFSRLNLRAGEQAAVLSANRDQIARLDTLQERDRQKREFLTQNRLLQPTITAWYADQIGASITGGIRLLELTVFPVDAAKIKSKQPEPRFLNDQIRVKGVSQTSADLNAWLKVLNSLEWVGAVTVLPYSEDQKGIGEFELKIELKDSK